MLSSFLDAVALSTLELSRSEPQVVCVAQALAFGHAVRTTLGGSALADSLRGFGVAFSKSRYKTLLYDIL
ncbi:MAG: hypothetical protein F6J90_27620 [Moorea sp. SIOASIH]|uniref:hypothetical protein n=1 Tax=Moorena sp. SIOASIH TaxID=2607817 RepID=UPI0013B5EE31|nr:hypothetical protein [Moorena sp. SIOASIH]NEO39898.1 hypothetical protein [Moorena sp. SIOASIH]